jgi:hypothetical protein
MDGTISEAPVWPAFVIIFPSADSQRLSLETCSNALILGMRPVSYRYLLVADEQSYSVIDKLTERCAENQSKARYLAR